VKEELPYSLSLREYFEAGKALLASTYPGHRDISEEQVSLGSRSAIKHVSTASLGDLTFKQMQIYLVEGSTGWVIACTVRLDWWIQYEAIFDTVVGSFRLLD
jgi:hypothetical protein